jgi:uncharacterized protein
MNSFPEQKTADYWISRLRLTRHPEGGYFRRIYEATEKIDKAHLPDRYNGPRVFSTAIYYLLPGHEFSAFHRLKSDELWHYYQGSPLTLYVLHSSGLLEKNKLGPNFDKGETFQISIDAGDWFAAAVEDHEAYTLAGCTVAPGFDFDDFELGRRVELVHQFPDHAGIINRFTR